MDLEVAIVAVGLAREQAFELALSNLLLQLLQCGLGLGDDARIALGLAQLDEPQLILELALDAAVAGDGVLELGALAQDGLRLGGLVPEIGVLGLGVQLIEPADCMIPVKDASSAGRAIPGSLRPPLALPHASRVPFMSPASGDGAL